MSEIQNPISDTWEAIKTRVAGPLGTFIMVWSIAHPQAISFILFDATGKSDTSQADAKIEKITHLLSSQSCWEIFWRPALWTLLALILLQITSLGWHWVCEYFRYFQQRITLKNEMRIALYQRFGKNPDDLVANIRSEVKGVFNILNNFPDIGNSISAVNETAKNQTMIASMQMKAKEGADKLDILLNLIKSASDEPLIEVFKKAKK